MCCLYRQIWEITPLLKWSPRPWGQILVKCCWIKEKVNNWDVFNVTATKILKHCKQKPWETGVKMCRKSMQWCFEYEWQMGATLRWKNKTRKQIVRNPQLLTLYKIFIAHLKRVATALFWSLMRSNLCIIIRDSEETNRNLQHQRNQGAGICWPQKLLSLDY